jgi:hypothetical protein
MFGYGLSLLIGAGFAQWAEAALETAGEVLVNLDASALTEGTLASLDAGRVFSQSEATNCPTVQTLPDRVKAVVFDGGDWMLSPGTGGTWLTNQAFTVEAWVKNSVNDGQESLFAWDVATTNAADTGDALVLNTNGQVCVHGPSLSLSFHQNVMPVSNQWHYVAVTFSGGDPSFWESGLEMVYVDGTLNAWVPASSVNGLWTSWLSKGTNALGARLTSSGQPTALFSGALARLRFHSGTLTPKQVRANYEAECGAFPALATNAPSSLATANELVLDLDAAGLSDGALASWSGNTTQTLTQATSSAQPKVGTTAGVRAVSFDGGDWLQVSGVDARLTDSNSTFTVETFIYNPSIDSEESYFCWAPRGNSGAAWDGKCRSVAYGSSAGYGAVGCWKSAWELGFTTVPAASLWHHIVTAYDGATMRVYVDGLLNASKAMAFNATTGLVYSVGRASSQDGTTIKYFSGAIARLRVHTGALTADQILANYRYLRVFYGFSDPQLAASGAYFGGAASYSDWNSTLFDGVAQVGETASMSLSATSNVARVGLTGAAALTVGSRGVLSVANPILVGAGDRSSGAPTSSLSVAGSLVSTYNSRYGLVVGHAGNGNLDVQPGGVLSMPNGAEFWVGEGNGGAGRLTVGSGARVTTTSWFLIGRSFGAGDVLLDGGTMSCGTASLGERSSNAVLRLKNGSALTAGTVYVGRNKGGAGTLLADGSTLTVTSAFFSGSEGGDYNQVVLTNRTALIKRGTSFSATQYGHGDFVVSDCSTVDVRDASSVVTFATNVGSIATIRIEKNSVFQLPATDSVLQIGAAGDATMEVTGGSRLQAAGIEMPGAASVVAGSSLLRVTDSMLSLGAGGVRSASAYVPSGLILSNATLRADTNTILFLPAVVKGEGSVIDTGAYTLTAMWPLSGDGLAKQGAGALNLIPKNALTGTVSITQGKVNIAPIPYVWCADDLTSFTNGQAVTSWQEHNYRISASSVAAGTGPALVTNAFNGKRSVRFNPASSTLLQIASGDNPVAGAESATIAVVFKPYAAGNASGLGAWWNSSQFIGGEVSGSANDWGFVFSQDSRIGMGLCQMSTAGNIDLMQYHATTATLSQPHVAICAWRPGAFALNLDGDETLNSTVYTAGSGGPTRPENIALPRVPATIYLGAGKATQNLALNSEVAEIRIFKNYFMDAYARQTLIRELGATYGVSAAASATMPTRPSYAGDLSQQTFAVTSVPPASAVWSASTLALADGASVSAWAATSGVCVAAAVSADGQANPAPTFASAAVGGLPAVLFYGRPLQLDAGDDPLVGKGELTAACVFQSTGSGTNAANWWSGSGLMGWKDSLTVNASDWGVAFTGNRIVAGGGACVSGSEYAGLYRGNYPFNYTRASLIKSLPRLDDGSPHVVVYRWSNHGLHAVSVDGQTTCLDSLSTYRMANLPLLLGGTRPEQTGFQGYVAEVRIYTNALTDSQEATVGGELASRYGVAASAYAQPERMPGSRIVLAGGGLAISTNAVSGTLATVQPGQTVAVQGSAAIDGVLCVAGQAALTLSSATDSLTVGDLALQGGATLGWKHNGRTSTPIHVTGDVGLSAHFTLDLTGSSGIPATQMTLIEYGGSATVPAGGVTATVVGAYKTGTKVVVVPAEKRVVVMTPAGTMVVVR